MSNPLYSQYSIEDFDKFDCLKISKVIYLTLLFCVRGYLVWIMSVTNMQDRVSVMQWVYPETHLFYLSLLSGFSGIFIIVLLSLRRPNAAPWVRAGWRNLRVLLAIALTIDLSINVAAHFIWHWVSLSWLITQCLIVATLLVLCFKSKRVAINISEFPEPLPEK